MSRIAARAILLAIVMLVTQQYAHSLDYSDVTFYLPFEQSPQPVIANGDPTPQVGEKKLTFSDGVVGKALIAGEPGMSLSYAAKDNINGDSGSLAVWLKPLNWTPADGKQHFYIMIPGRMLFYHYWEGATATFLWMEGSKVKFGAGHYPPLNKDK